MTTLKTTLIALTVATIAWFGTSTTHAGDAKPTTTQVLHLTVKVDGLDIFYREAGQKDAPAVLLLHGFPTSSHMFRNLIPALADKYHVVAPDYPGYGNSSAPSVKEFEYTFDNLANIVEKFMAKVGLKKYSIYLMDYGAPVGFCLAVKHPERVEALIVQNGNAYDEGIDNDFWKPIKAYWKNRTKAQGDKLRSLLTLEATKWQYTHGVRNVETISPDTWGHVQPLLDRPGNQEIQLALFHSYGSNPPLYPQWQANLRKHQPPTGYAKMEERSGWQTTVTPELTAFLSELDMFYLGTANAEGRPYIQYRGGAPGFLKVIDEKTLGFADFGGNRQYITFGNLSDNPKAFIFLMDYANSRRIKLWGTARVVEDDPDLLERLQDPEYPGRVERAILFSIEAWDVNCPQHIHKRFPQSMVAPIIEKLQTQVRELQAKIAEYEQGEEQDASSTN